MPGTLITAPWWDNHVIGSQSTLTISGFTSDTFSPYNGVYTMTLKSYSSDHWAKWENADGTVLLDFIATTYNIFRVFLLPCSDCYPAGNGSDTLADETAVLTALRDGYTLTYSTGDFGNTQTGFSIVWAGTELDPLPDSPGGPGVRQPSCDAVGTGTAFGLQLNQRAGSNGYWTYSGTFLTSKILMGTEFPVV